MYQIIELCPVYHFSTDAYIGERVSNRSHGYLTLALAHKVAGIRAQHDYQGCGDNSFVVVPFGGDPWRDRLIDPSLRTTADLEIPF